jgi:hypothetical protein
VVVIGPTKVVPCYKAVSGGFLKDQENNPSNQEARPKVFKQIERGRHDNI